MEDFDALFNAQLHRELEGSMDGEKQLRREQLMNQMGSSDLKKAEIEAENKAYASHTIYGSFLRKNYLEPIAEALAEQFETRVRAKAGQGFSALHEMHGVLDWKRVAHITLSLMIDHAAVPKYVGFLKENSRRAMGKKTVSEVYMIIGRAIQSEMALLSLKRNFRGAYKRLKEKCFTEHASYRTKIYRAKRYIDSYREYYERILTEEHSEDKDEYARKVLEKFHWTKWTDRLCLQVGSWLAKVVNAKTDWFAEMHGFDERGRNRPLFVFSDELESIKSALFAQSEVYAYFPLPMLIPPVPWSGSQNGGYVLNEETYKQAIVRGWHIDTKVTQLTIDFINNQQNVGFRINPFVQEVQKKLFEKGWTIHGSSDLLTPADLKDSWRPYRRPEPWEVPTLPEDLRAVKKPKRGASEEERERYKARKAEDARITEWHTRQLTLLELGRPTARFMRAVNLIKNDETFYFPWNLDWRTRCYPMIDTISPQGPEYHKAVLDFATDTPLDERSEIWMARGVASAAGMDKKSFREREQWTHDNLDLIARVAVDPISDGWDIWTNMPEPWIFLRACKEYYECFIACSKSTTNIFCLGQDATCSGLQLLGGMMHDLATCDIVNCTPGHDEPQDAYGAVLSRTIELIKENEHSALNKRRILEKIRGKRFLTKLCVMTKAYAAGHDTRVTQVKEALAEKDIELAYNDDRNDELIEILVTTIEKAMDEVVPASKYILEWFQETAKAAFEKNEGTLDLKYMTPSGNYVTCVYRKPITERVEVELLGNTIITPGSKELKDRRRPQQMIGVGDVDIDDGIRAIGANLTHGAGDASLLHVSFHDAPEDLLYATTHDCVYAPPSKMVDEINRRVREGFIRVCAFDVLTKFAFLNGVPECVPPEISITDKESYYDPETVRDAEYFFC